MRHVFIYRMTVWNPSDRSAAVVYATRPEHLPVDAFLGCHLLVERISVDSDSAVFESALDESFAFLVGPLRVRA